MSQYAVTCTRKEIIKISTSGNSGGKHCAGRKRTTPRFRLPARRGGRLVGSARAPALSKGYARSSQPTVPTGQSDWDVTLAFHWARADPEGGFGIVAEALRQRLGDSPFSSMPAWFFFASDQPEARRCCLSEERGPPGSLRGAGTTNRRPLLVSTWLYVRCRKFGRSEGRTIHYSASFVSCHHCLSKFGYGAGSA